MSVLLQGPPSLPTDRADDLRLEPVRWTEKAVRKARGGEPVSEGESDLARLDIIGERGSFAWVRPEHMEPTGVPTSAEVREKLREQVAECLGLLAQLGQGEGALCRVRMSVNGLGKIDLYQWLDFLAQHARRHLQQLEVIERQFGLCNDAPCSRCCEAIASGRAEGWQPVG
jgi:hypothetical protein